MFSRKLEDADVALASLIIMIKSVKFLEIIYCSMNKQTF